jgi:tetrapyrrole methylase family protein/MazG family protein
LSSAGSSLAKLVEVMAHLRSQQGCPWDREQTHETLKPFLLEESYEVLDAIDAGDDDELCKELGDVLLQVVFHAQIANEENRFNVDDVCKAVVDKLVHRHPHVFGDVEVDGSDEVITNWERIKREERSGGETPASVLDGVPKLLPALLRAQRVQEKASRVGFDWTQISGPLEKVSEEFEELRREWKHLQTDSPEARERCADELGDLLFALVNVARFQKFSPEEALRQAVGKFERRFRVVEQKLQERGRMLEECSLEEMDRVWEEVKELEQRTP